MKHVKNILKILPFSLIEFVVELLAYVIVPVAVTLIQVHERVESYIKGKVVIKDRLYPIFSWWDDYKYGINGDPYWSGIEHADGKQHMWLWRVLWLWRNKANTFSHTVIGIDMNYTTDLIVSGDVNTSNRPNGKPGFLYIEARQGNKTYPCYYIVYRWGKSNKCFRAYIGWKLKHYINNGTFKEAVSARQHSQFTTAINPLMTFEE